MSRRDRAAACRLREAHFPEVKTLDQIDWQALSGVSRPKILELASVLFTRAADLVRNLREARDDRSLGQLHRRLQRADLLVVDELGFVPFDRVGGELLFNLLSERYETRSTSVTTNLTFGEWVQVFGDEKLTTALLDRLTHHAHILTTRGNSYRTSRQRS